MPKDTKLNVNLRPQPRQRHRLLGEERKKIMLLILAVHGGGGGADYVGEE
jgi:hypothetical protein